MSEARTSRVLFEWQTPCSATVWCSADGFVTRMTSGARTVLRVPKTQSFSRVRALPLILATFLLVLPTPSMTVHVAKLVVLSVLFVINSRWGETRVWYAFVLYLVVLLASFIPVLHTWNPIVVPAIVFALMAYVSLSRLATNMEEARCRGTSRRVSKRRRS